MIHHLGSSIAKYDTKWFGISSNTLLKFWDQICLNQSERVWKGERVTISHCVTPMIKNKEKIKMNLIRPCRLVKLSISINSLV